MKNFHSSEARPNAERSSEFGWQKKNWTKKKGTTTTSTTNFVLGQTIHFLVEVCAFLLLFQPSKTFSYVFNFHNNLSKRHSEKTIFAKKFFGKKKKKLFIFFFDFFFWFFFFDFSFFEFFFFKFFFRFFFLCPKPTTLKITVPKRPQIRLPPPPSKWPFFWGGQLFFWERFNFELENSKFLFRGNILWGKSGMGLGRLADCIYPAGTIGAWILIFADLGHFYSHFLRSNLVISNVYCQNDDSEWNLAIYSLKFFLEVK